MHRDIILFTYQYLVLLCSEKVRSVINTTLVLRNIYMHASQTIAKAKSNETILQHAKQETHHKHTMQQHDTLR